jgi:hypothetical protein
MCTIQTHDLVAAFVEDCTAAVGQTDYAGVVVRVEGGKGKQMVRRNARGLLRGGDFWGE